MCHNNITLCNHSTISIKHSIIKCLSTMPRKEIELDTDVEDEIEEVLEEA
jgi:hypothetical protein